MSDLEQQPPVGEPQRVNALPPLPAVPPQRAHPSFWMVIGVAVVLFVVMTVLTTAAAVLSESRESGMAWFPGSKVAIVPVEGEIFESAPTVQQ